MLLYIAPYPTAVFWLPVWSSRRAESPNAESALPVVMLESALVPKAVLFWAAALADNPTRKRRAVSPLAMLFFPMKSAFNIIVATSLLDLQPEAKLTYVAGRLQVC